MSETALSPEAIEASFTPRRRAGVAWVEIEGEGLLYDDEHQAWHLLNPTAFTVWRLSDGSGTAGELAEDLSEVLGLDLEEARTGVVEALRELGRQGLLEGVRGEERETDLPPLDPPPENGGAPVA